MTPWLHLVVLAFSKAAPLLLASFGGLLSEVGGVINFSLEGMMLIGAFGAMWASFASGSPWVGLLGGALGGAIVGMIHATVSLKLKANQIVSSFAMNLMAAGITGTLLNQVFGIHGTSPAVPRLPGLAEALSSILPRAGAWSTVAGLPVLAPIALLLALCVTGFLRWTSSGLNLRACGENSLAASAAGIPVFRTRFLAVTAGGLLAGMGGAYLSIGVLSQFVEQMTQGRGYLAIAALILGRWRPSGVFAAALFFGVTEALSEWLAVRWSNLPQQAFLALPYVVCFIVLACQVGRTKPPSSLGRI